MNDVTDKLREGSQGGSGKLTGIGMATLIRLLTALSDIADEADYLRNTVMQLQPFGSALRALQRDVLNSEMSDADQLDRFTSLVATFHPLDGMSIGTTLINVADYVSCRGRDSLSDSFDDAWNLWYSIIETVLGPVTRRSLE